MKHLKKFNEEISDSNFGNKALTEDKLNFSKEEFLEYFNKVSKERMNSKDLYMYVDNFIEMAYPPKRQTWKEHLKDPNGPWNWNKTPEEKKNESLLTEAVDLRCPNCQDNLGKDVENPGWAYCGNCGESEIFNERGDTDDMSEEELSKWKKMKAKRKGGSFIRRY